MPQYNTTTHTSFHGDYSPSHFWSTNLIDLTFLLLYW